MEQAEVEDAYDPPTPPDAAADPEDPEQSATPQEEALAYVAGYVAYKCRHIDPTLGHPSADVQRSRVPDAWIRAVSRGALYVPSEPWLAKVTAFDIRFKAIMGPTADCQPLLLTRLMAEVTLVDPALDKRVVRTLTTTRLFVRLRTLNKQGVKLPQASIRRATNQTKMHCRGNRQ